MLFLRGSTMIARQAHASVFWRCPRDRCGSVSVLFGLGTLLSMVVVGVAIDMARYLSARTITRSAIDTAVLAGVRFLQVSGGNAATAAAVAQHFYAENTMARVALARDTIAFRAGGNGTVMTVEGEATLKTLVMKLFGVAELPLLRVDGRDYAQALRAFGANADQSLEIALMLDVTRSMAGEKLAQMKAAAKEFVDIVVWNNGTEHTSRIALVPFADTVRLETALYDRVVRGADQWSLPKMFPLAAGLSVPWFVTDRCVGERSGDVATTDAPPRTDEERFPAVYGLDGVCRPTSAEVVPLTSDKSLLHARIDALSAAGSTAGHIGTAWAWYLLSPRWAPYLPPESAPGDDADLEQMNERGRPLRRKIAILLTDGAYDTEYCVEGMRAKRSGAEAWTADCASANGTSTDQARAICAGMKASGITVFTVALGPEVDDETAATLMSCASSPRHHFAVATAPSLRHAFREMALRISALYLNK